MRYRGCGIAAPCSPARTARLDRRTAPNLPKVRSLLRYRKNQTYGFSLCRVGVCGLPGRRRLCVYRRLSASCGGETELSDGVGFRLPDIPDTLRGAARAEYLALHYWDGFDFAGADIAAPEAEQAFVDFLGLLSRIASADGAFGALFGRAAGSDGLYRLMELCDRYLYEPWSPMRSDELYAAALRAFTESPCIAEIDKVRARQALERLSMNRPGTPGRPISSMSTAAGAGIACRISRHRIFCCFSTIPVAGSAAG